MRKESNESEIDFVLDLEDDSEEVPQRVHKQKVNKLTRNKI
jgi:hypothetical protein